MLAGACLLAAATFLAAARPNAPEGAALFNAKCIMCHGQDGKGFSAIHTPDFTDPKWQAGVTDQQIFDTIKNGKKDTMMKPFGDKLKDDEIQALVKFIRSVNSGKK